MCTGLKSTFKDLDIQKMISALLVDHFLQCLVDGRRTGRHGQGVDATDFKTTLDCGENLILVHVISLVLVFLDAPCVLPSSIVDKYQYRDLSD